MTKKFAAFSATSHGLKLKWIVYTFYLKLSLISIFLHGSLYAKETPNFILVLTDDQGWTSLSATMDLRRPSSKSDYHKTPNMDAILSAECDLQWLCGCTSLLANTLQYTIWQITRTAKFYKSVGAKRC